MTLEVVDTASLPEGVMEKIAAALTELQGLKFTLVAGAGSATNIAVAGISLTDTLVAVLEVQPPTAGSGNTLTDRKSVTTITSAGNIQLSTVSTGNQLLVVWFDKAP